jgi:serine/threonine protein kinase
MAYNDLLVDKMENGYILGKKWRIVDYINNGGCAIVYLVQDSKGTLYAAKVTTNTLSFTLGHEYDIYKILKDSPCVPKLPRRAFGYDNGRTYMIMQLLGSNLRQYRRYFPDKQVPLEYISVLGLQAVSFLEYIHERGYLYLDVKPENFLLAAGTDGNTPVEELKLYCADFGLSQRYVINGKHRPFRYVRSRVGTLNFMSVNVETRQLPSRRDDLESLVFVLIFLQKGCLPWEYVTDDAYGLKMKRNLEDYISDIEMHILDFLHHVRGYSYEQDPDYRYIKKLIKKIGVEEERPEDLLL